MYTDNLISGLIEIPKFIVDPPKNIEPRGGYSKRKFFMKSDDHLHDFSAFINHNETFQENFSIGLVYISKSDLGKVVLLRCNGAHGEHESAKHHIACHIHYSTADRINNKLRPEGKIEMTNEYVTIEEAIQYFIKKIGLNAEDRRKYFPIPNPQIDLFGGNL